MLRSTLAWKPQKDTASLVISLSIKGLVHFQNKNFLIIYSPPCHPRCSCFSFFSRKEITFFEENIPGFFSIEWTSMAANGFKGLYNLIMKFYEILWNVIMKNSISICPPTSKSSDIDVLPFFVTGIRLSLHICFVNTGSVLPPTSCKTFPT